MIENRYDTEFFTGKKICSILKELLSRWRQWYLNIFEVTSKMEVRMNRENELRLKRQDFPEIYQYRIINEKKNQY